MAKKETIDTEKSVDIPAKFAATGVTLQTTAGDIQITFNTAFAGNVSTIERDQKLDELVESLERQKCMKNIPNLERALQKAKSNYEEIIERVKGIDEKAKQQGSRGHRDGTPRMSVGDEKTRHDLVNQGKELKDGILFEERRLAFMKEKLGIKDVAEQKAAKAA